MRKIVSWLGLCLAMLNLPACQTLTVDESFVFQPGQFGDPNAVRTSPMRYEKIFSEPVDLIIDVWADDQTAQHIIKSENFVTSLVTHDAIKSPTGNLAITRVERAGQGRPLVVHCGGNASDRYESGALYAQKIILFADVLMFDYPGYGESTGRADAQSLKHANKMIADYVKSEISPGKELVLWGHSLGGFVCADMAKSFGKIDGLVLEATATNAEDVSEALIPWYAKLFVRPRVSESLNAYDMTESLKTLNAPILILGAAKDKTLPVELSRKLAENLNEAGREVTYVEFREGNHISIPTQPAYQSTIARFISGLATPEIDYSQYYMRGGT